MFSQGNEWNEQRKFSWRYLRDFGFGKQHMEDLIKVIKTNNFIKNQNEHPNLNCRKKYKRQLSFSNATWIGPQA